jgi:hypothetical protein
MMKFKMPNKKKFNRQDAKNAKFFISKNAFLGGLPRLGGSKSYLFL